MPSFQCPVYDIKNSKIIVHSLVPRLSPPKPENEATVFTVSFPGSLHHKEGEHGNETLCSQSRSQALPTIRREPGNEATVFTVSFPGSPHHKEREPGNEATVFTVSFPSSLHQKEGNPGNEATVFRFKRARVYLHCRGWVQHWPRCPEIVVLCERTSTLMVS